jgi:hypothetical protein
MIDDTPYDIFCMKEEDYVMKIISTYMEIRLVPADSGATI